MWVSFFFVLFGFLFRFDVAHVRVRYVIWRVRGGGYFSSKGFVLQKGNAREELF